MGYAALYRHLFVTRLEQQLLIVSSHRLLYFLETAGSSGGADTCPFMVAASRNVAGSASRCKHSLKNIADVSQGSAIYTPKHQAAAPPSRTCGDMLVSPSERDCKSMPGCLKRA